MPDATTITHPLLRLGRLELGPGLRGLQPGRAASDLVLTATVPVPEAAGNPAHAWDTAWVDAVRQAEQLGADPGTAQALAGGAGNVLDRGARAAGETRVVVAARGQVLLARWVFAPEAAEPAVWAGPLPRLRQAAAAAARRPAYVVVLADRHGTDILAHDAGDQEPATRFPAEHRPGAQRDPHPDRPPAQLHGVRHLTDSEPESGGERNDEFIAGRVSDAANSVGAHIVLGAGDQHILDAVAAHLPDSIGPITAIGGGRHPGGHDDHLIAAIGAALDDITAGAARAVGERIVPLATGEDPAAALGVPAVAEQLAEQQVGVLVVAADLQPAEDADASYTIGIQPTEFLVSQPDIGVEVPMEDGLVWAALHQDAIVLEFADRGGVLAGEDAGALLRRGSIV
jgi:Bacterial archaeo-eukaryotic release factor family 2